MGYKGVDCIYYSRLPYNPYFFGEVWCLEFELMGHVDSEGH